MRGVTMKILIFGGTSFFGKQLVKDLILEGHEITVATRGNRKPFDRVIYLQLNRNNKSSLEQLRNSSWDRVYDQICMNEQNAKDVLRLFKHVGLYIHTSTGSVYDGHSSGHSEDQLDMTNYELKKLDQSSWATGESYGENKRRAEAVFFQQTEFPVAAIRFCIVLGQDDTSQRLIFHVERINSGKAIFIPNLQARMSFITQEDASSFLRLVGNNNLKGAFNISSGVLSIGEVMKIIEQELDKKLILTNEKEQESFSPYGIEQDWIICNKKAKEVGFKTEVDLTKYIVELIK
jgi:nucleoside-diphosphate-sugar epimerase